MLSSALRIRQQKAAFVPLSGSWQSWEEQTSDKYTRMGQGEKKQNSRKCLCFSQCMAGYFLHSRRITVEQGEATAVQKGRELVRLEGPCSSFTVRGVRPGDGAVNEREVSLLCSRGWLVSSDSGQQQTHSEVPTYRRGNTIVYPMQDEPGERNSGRIQRAEALPTILNVVLRATGNRPGT